jgi:uncharacterized protein Yka (UPF0111/DUF47 family)
MNNDRRKDIKQLLDKIDKLTTPLDELRDNVENARIWTQQIIDEEEEAIANLPDNVQESDRANDMRKAVEQLEQARDDLEELYEKLLEGFGDIPNLLEEAAT